MDGPGITTPKFRTGDLVRVRQEPPKGHVRTPAYIQGKVGRVDMAHGPYLNPESLAYGGAGLPAQPLYMVSFDQSKVWENYQGAADDKVYVDIFEHWLEPT